MENTKKDILLETIPGDTLQTMWFTGLVALSRLNIVLAKKIFFGLSVIVPTRGYPKIGLGLTAVLEGDFSEGIKLLEVATLCPFDQIEAKEILNEVNIQCAKYKLTNQSYI